MELKLSLGGVEYTAPPPRVQHFKQYLRLLRTAKRAEQTGSDEDIDSEFGFIVSLFDNPAVTIDRVEKEASFAEMARLHRDYLVWIAQFFPEDEKKTKNR